MPRRKKTPVEKGPALEAIPDIVENAPETTRSEAMAKEDQGIKLEDLRVAYVVGLTPDNNFVFELFGQDPGLVELLGIHAHAINRIQRIYDDKQIQGDRLTHEVGKAVAILNQKLDQILQVIAPREPDNKLG